ncbi:reverse transcriptase domain-containing protein [Tanacetum coccineum]|uniref:Reverse transcriptase domain-containing protein n=1 Tax=Tanacetum coccineum TaxID=301880 RepID=A0ABQ5BSG1_9ASTR
MKEMRDGCNSCGGPYPSSECDDKPMGGPKDKEANYAYEGYRGRGYRGNYYGRSFRNWRDRQPRDENQNSQPQEDIPSNPSTPEKKFDESDFEKTMREFMVAQKSSNDFVKNQFFNLKTKFEQGQKNHQASIQDLEIKFGRLSDQCSSRPTGSLPINPNAKTAVIHDDSEYEIDKSEKEVEPSSYKQTESDPPPLKAINVPLVDVLTGMPNYEKFLKDLVSNKSKMEQISVAFLNEECSSIVQNKLPPKLGDTGSFLIPCTVASSVEYLALADLGASINLMPYSLYASLSENTLKPIRMRIRLANHTY